MGGGNFWGIVVIVKDSEMITGKIESIVVGKVKQSRLEKVSLGKVMK